jgi:hydroxymethylglutaryl-CoA lyase
MSQSNHITLVEVSARDGLQNDAVNFSIDQKVALIEHAIAAGITRHEVASFVHPGRVPQMADADDLLAALPVVDGVVYAALVLNDRGLDRALATNVHEINTVVVVTDTFCRKNQGTTTQEALAMWERVATRAVEAGRVASVTIASAFGCPYEGEVPLDRLREVVARAAGAAPGVEVSLADTIGCAVPTDIAERVGLALDVLPAGTALRLHLHNTRNTGLANVAAGVTAGVRVFDTSLGGIGGCPFAPNATGNVPTEDVVYMLDRMGYPTGVSLERLTSGVEWLQQQLGRAVPGLLAKAGPFPRPVTG